MLCQFPLVRLQFFPTLIFFTNLAIEVDEEEQKVVILIHVCAAQYLLMVVAHEIVNGFDSGETGGWKTLLAPPELSLTTSHFHPT